MAVVQLEPDLGKPYKFPHGLSFAVRPGERKRRKFWTSLSLSLSFLLPPSHTPTSLLAPLSLLYEFLVLQWPLPLNFFTVVS